MGSAASNQHRDIFKTCKLCLSDRNMNVRAAAARVGKQNEKKIPCIEIDLFELNNLVHVGSHETFFQCTSAQRV